MNASFEEKSAWIQLLALAIALGSYFAVAAVMLSSGITSLAPYVPVFIVATIVLVLLLVVGHAAAAIARRPEPRDERDRLIEWRAEANSGHVLGFGVLLSIFGLITPIETVWIAHALLASLFLAEIAKLVFQLAYYRRGV